MWHTDVSPIVFDIETAPLPNAFDYLEPPDVDGITAPANYKDPEKIAAYIAEAKAKKLDEHANSVQSGGALDWNIARIVALGWWAEGETTIRVMSGEDEGEDARWSAAQNIDQPTIEILCAVVSQFYRRSTSYTDWYDRDRLLWVTVAYPQDQPGAWGCEVFLSFTDDDTQEP